MRSRFALGVAILTVGIVTIAAQQPAPAAKPGPEHARLAVFLGKWNSEGQALASPWGTAGKIASVSTYEWLPGNFFLIQRWDGRQGTTEIKGIEIYGYDTRSKKYTGRFFDNAGNSGLDECTFSGNTWACTTDAEVGKKPLKERSTTVISGDVMTNKSEYSTDGSKWMPDFEAKSTRVK